MSELVSECVSESVSESTKANNKNPVRTQGIGIFFAGNSFYKKICCQFYFVLRNALFQSSLNNSHLRNRKSNLIERKVNFVVWR